MERIPELVKHLETEMEKILQVWHEQSKHIKIASIEDTMKQVYTHGDLGACVVITYLRSSCVTESHQFKVAVYPKKPFIDDPTYYTFLELKSLYMDMPQYVENLIKKLTPPYFQILSYEQEEIKRKFMAKLYERSGHFFECVINEMASGEKKIPVYFGEEMGELTRIGDI